MPTLVKVLSMGLGYLIGQIFVFHILLTIVNHVIGYSYLHLFPYKKHFAMLSLGDFIT